MNLANPPSFLQNDLGRSPIYIFNILFIYNNNNFVFILFRHPGSPVKSRVPEKSSGKNGVRCGENGVSSRKNGVTSRYFGVFHGPNGVFHGKNRVFDGENGVYIFHLFYSEFSGVFKESSG